MAEKTTPESKPVTIDDPEQASTNFYWTYATTAGVFNLQTTIRGILSLEQVQAHIAAGLLGVAEVDRLGGLAKQVGKGADIQPEQAQPIPQSTASPVSQPSAEPQYVPVAEPTPPVAQPQAETGTFMLDIVTASLGDDGQLRHKGWGKPWNKYGVPIYPEVFEKVGINPQKLVPNEKGYNFKGWKATYVKNKNGNPQKITVLEKVA